VGDVVDGERIERERAGGGEGRLIS